jgi:hypothetical protein
VTAGRPQTVWKQVDKDATIAAVEKEPGKFHAILNNIGPTEHLVAISDIDSITRGTNSFRPPSATNAVLQIAPILIRCGYIFLLQESVHLRNVFYARDVFDFHESYL